MNRRSWAALALAVFAVVTVPEVVAALQPDGVARASVCVGAGRRVSVSGCANIGDAIARYAPPPAEYAPMPEDSTPPPPPP